MPSLVVDLDDREDVERSIKILQQHQVNGTQQPPVPNGDPAGAMIDRLYPRLGSNLQTVLETVASKPEGSKYTIESLAKELQIQPASLRGKMNSALRRSWKKVADEVAHAPEIFVWESRGDRWAFSMTPEVRNAILARKQP
jgi:hypothetical protein